PRTDPQKFSGRSICSAGWRAPRGRGRGPLLARRDRLFRNDTRPASDLSRLSLEKSGNPLDKSLGLLDLGMVPGAVDQRELRTGDELAVGATVIRCDHPIAGTPHQEARYRDPSEPARQLRIIHVGVPGIKTERFAVARVDDQGLVRYSIEIGREPVGVVPAALPDLLGRPVEDVEDVGGLAVADLDSDRI